jgi:hypothetical protein
MEQVAHILQQAKDAAVQWIYFEGGEPFLYYPVLVQGARLAADMGFSVGIVSNAYWAVTVADAVEWLRPFAGQVSDLTVSRDLFHGEGSDAERPENAIAAAKSLKIPTGVICISKPGGDAGQTRGQLSDGSAVMFRGRAAKVLAPASAMRPWVSFTDCPHEDLRNPGRVHLDPLGNVHVCQGILIGNLFTRSLKEICDGYHPAAHAICGPLLEGGPAALVSEYGLSHDEVYADACHLCYEARLTLRSRLPDVLGPAQMYGVDA